jgi:hypothetical protein
MCWFCRSRGSSQVSGCKIAVVPLTIKTLSVRGSGKFIDKRDGVLFKLNRCVSSRKEKNVRICKAACIDEEIGQGCGCTNVIIVGWLKAGYIFGQGIVKLHCTIVNCETYYYREKGFGDRAKDELCI